MSTPATATATATITDATLEKILSRLAEKFPDAPAAATLVANPGPAQQHSLLLDNATAAAVATFLRDDPDFQLDYCSNVTGIDWIKDGYLEAVYHLYSVAKKTAAPVVLRLRTATRDLPTADPAGGVNFAASSSVSVPSLTPVWRSCELQEREIYDLFGIVFIGHPDLRRLLMWDEFKDYPMRKDYLEPDDYEWEPTPHNTVLEKAKKHWPKP
jgi:NADH-quinone oxidoreductase subunit C